MRHGLAGAALLAGALLSGAANDAGIDTGDTVRTVPVTGQFGDYLGGRGAMFQGDAVEAAPLLKSALPLDPDGTELVTQALIASVLAGRPDAELAAKVPGNLVGQLVLINRDALAGNWTQAQARAGALPDDGITQVLRPLLIAWTQEGAGQLDQALATLAPAVSGPRFRPVFALHAALIADLASRPGDAASLYRAAQAEFGGINLRLGMILASWQARLGHADEAAALIQSTVRAAPDTQIAQAQLLKAANEPAVRNALDGMAEGYLALAATLGQQDTTNGPPALIELALQVRPDFTAARIVLSDLLDQAKHPEASLRALAPVTTADPLYDVVQLRRGALLDEAHRPGEAADVLRALIAARPDRPEPLALLADIQRRQSQFADAVRDYDRAVAVLGQPTARDWALFYERGVALDRSGDWTRAQENFQHALALSPDQAYVLNYLAYAWTERGINLDQAKTMLQQAVSLRPEDGAIVDSLGWLLLKMGDTAGATARLERAVELEPEDPSINGHLGDAYAADHRLREAEFQWRRALNLKPDPEEQTRIEAKLRELQGN